MRLVLAGEIDSFRRLFEEASAILGISEGAPWGKGSIVGVPSNLSPNRPAAIFAILRVFPNEKSGVKIEERTFIIVKLGILMLLAGKDTKQSIKLWDCYI